MTTMTRKQTRLQRWTAMAEDAGLHLEFMHYRHWRQVTRETTPSGTPGRKQVSDRITTATADQIAKRSAMYGQEFELVPTGGHTHAVLRRAGRDGEVLITASFIFVKQKQTYYFPTGRKLEYYVERNYDKRIGRAAAGGKALKQYFASHPYG